MPQIKVTITDDEYALLQTRATNNLNSISKEARLILHHVLFTDTTHEIAGLEFPAVPSIISSTTQVQPLSYANANTTATTTPTPQYTYTPDPKAGSIHIPAIDPSTIKDYTQPTQSNPSTQPTQPAPSKPEPKRVIGGPDDMPAPKATPTAYKKPKSTIPVATDLEVEQVDNEWDAEGNEYSTADFVVDLRNLEDKLRDDSPFTDPTRDPDYLALKNYFIKHDLRERFRSLLSDPSRFYPEEGVYNQPQIKYAQTAFRKEKIDYDYIVALLSGTGDNYRRTHKMKLYVDEQ